ncbi:MAG: response regulator [Leptonema illini]|jgi:two-component system chemotaxis response regulator CheY|uniref:Response regulator n=1 Tax=Leptonema illini TaxID=183 RepID=A0A833H1M3_9LEPT|nr:MAG: response regulator [Leptonema illini]PKL32442.1 MAG: two-component system response regulator [Spirochaetae bacterium HGW-Spirochaetae-10]
MAKNILIIDDSAAQRKVVRLALESKGYQIFEATDGQDALQRLSPDLHLIVCDVNMPIMDGLEFVRQIKANEQYKFLPIIMLTTESQEAMREQGMELGVRAWLNKPFSMEQLLDAVARLML